MSGLDIEMTANVPFVLVLQLKYFSILFTSIILMDKEESLDLVIM